MRILLILLTTTGMVAATTGNVVIGTDELTITPSPGFNSIAFTIYPSGVPSSSDTTVIDGSVIADISVDTTTDQVVSFSLRDGRVDADDPDTPAAPDAPNSVDLSFASQTAFVSYWATFTDVAASISTITAPTTISDLSTGAFDASNQRFVVDQGTSLGLVTIAFPPRTRPISGNFAPPNQLRGAGSGTGNITLTPTGSANGVKSYDVVMTFPMSIDETQPTESGTLRTVASGIVRAEGSIDVAVSPYLAWTTAEGIAGADPDDDINGDGLPNAFAWAYGLSATDFYPNGLPRATSAAGFEIPLPAGGTAAPILIEVSTTLGVWDPLPAGRCSTGINPLPIGTANPVTITPSGLTEEFLRISVDE